MTELGQAPVGTSQAPARSAFLDAVRAVALVRVVLWHTYSAAALSYVAAMPLMFFVAGALAGRPSGDGGWTRFIGRRLRRLLPPLWAYALVAWAVFATARLAGGRPMLDVPFGEIISWIVPIWDPTGPEWAIAWWAPLWYLRAYLWLVLLTPALRSCVRRAPVFTMLVPVVAVVASGVLAEHGVHVASAVRDLFLFGFFWVLGLAHGQGRIPAWRPGVLVALGVAVGGAGIGWMATRSVPLGIVNASYGAHLLLGLGWVLLALGCQRAITAAATRPRVQPWVELLNRRAVTIYVWHCAAVFCGYELADHLALHGAARWLLLAVVVVSVTALCAAVFGWVEDLAARRGARMLPVAAAGPRRTMTLGAAAGAVVVVLGLLWWPGVPAADGVASNRFVPASGRGIEFLAQSAIESHPAPRPDAGFDGPVDASPVAGAELSSELDSWAREWDVSGAVAAVRTGDDVAWTGATGVDGRGRPMDPGQPVPMQSITKSYTAALILLLAVRDGFDLDAPVAQVAPELPHAEAITARQLLYHRSGLGASGLPPREALEEASTQPLAFTPGEDWLYSDVGYFALGVLAERFTGERYTTLVRRRLLKPLHLRDTYMEEKIDPTSEDHDPSRNRWSAGGLISTVDDAAAWAVGFWGAGLDTAVSSFAVELDASTRLGAGTFGFCPCSTDEAGALRAGSYGHISPGGRTAWSGEDGLGIAVHTIESLDQRMFDAWADLDSRLRRRVAGRALDPTLG